MTNTNLPDSCYHRSLSGARIPHTVNPGPQLCCPRCKLTRFGSDFRMVAGALACRYCVEVG